MELQSLGAAVDSVLAGRGGACFLVGDPGIGKTTLVDRAATEAEGRGARVLWGRCWQAGNAPAYWPWTQILRAALRGRLPEREERELEWARDEIERVFLDSAAAELDPLRDTDQARFRLFDATSSFLVAHARERPLLLVLDDLHDADEPSLRLLHFVLREARSAPILVLATYREAEVRRSASLSALFGALSRESRRMPLAGFNREEVGAFMDAVAARTLGSSSKEAVWRATEGNPFFVDEVVRLLLARATELEGGAPLAIPDTVREATRRRLVPLAPRVRELLAAASVLGRDFDLGLLSRLSATSVADCAHVLEEAVVAGVVRCDDVAGRAYTFCHVLLRETLHEDLDADRRRRLHLAVAERLAADRDAGDAVSEATIAHHFLEALPVADPATVRDRVLRAAREAGDRLAFEEAERYFDRAVALLEAGERDPFALAAVLIELADARRFGGELVSARRTYLRAVGLLRPGAGGARRGEGPVQALFARAVLGFGRVAETGEVDREVVALLEEALDVVGPGDGALRASLLARLGMALYFASDPERCRRLTAEAVAMATRIGDRHAEIHALVAHHFAIWGPDTAEERRAVATRTVELCDHGGELELGLEARLWRICDLLELGEAFAADRERLEYARRAEASRLPLYRWHARLVNSCFAFVRGELEEAEKLSADALEIGLRAELPNARPFRLAQAFELGTAEGKAARLEGDLAEVAAALPSMPIWRCCLARAYLSSSRLEDARRELLGLASEDYRSLPRDGTWLPCLALLAEVAAGCGDTPEAERLYRLLEPFAAGWVVSVAAITTSGPVEHFLGLLALALGRDEEARARLARAAAASRAFGFRRLAEASERALNRTCTAVSETATPAASGSAEGEFRCEGEFWTVGSGGASLRLRDSKGLRYIHYLIENEEREFHVLELSAAVEGVEADGAAADLGDAGEILDQQAASQYRGRLAELREELEEAEANHDRGRAERLGEEIEFLARELAAGIGLGGRRRRAKSAAESARVRVTKVIGLALRRIADGDPALGRHLQRGVRTGTFCSYRADPDRPLRWRTR